MRTEKDRLHEKAMEDFRDEQRLQQDRRDLWSKIVQQELAAGQTEPHAMGSADQILEKFDKHFDV